jgi:hypothetical protein
MVNGKQKGNFWERRVSNILSERFEPYLGIKSGFRRSVDSGSFFGGTNKRRTQTHSLDFAVFGDIICPNNFLYSIECKSYKTPPSFKSVINHNVSQWDTWLKQAEQDAISANKEMVLIVKYNNVDPIVFLHNEIPNVAHNLYQQYHIHLLSDWLTMPDLHFFKSESP